MENGDKKQIRLALIAMAIILMGTELIVSYISREAYSTNEIRIWFAFLIATLYYVFAKQISEATQNKKKDKKK